MGTVDLRFPPFADDRGPGYWLRPGNIMASRYMFFRSDHSNEWRYAFSDPAPSERIVPFDRLLLRGRNEANGFRCILIGDTGEGDRSQYGLLPLIRGLEPDFMIINGDSANPAGRMNEQDPRFDDYLHGFFEPYRNLGIPIWAVPGNHEYYSPNNGREFHDVFCTRKHDRLWTEYGIPHLPQPGTYWELNDGTQSKLTIIGLDTGKSGDLDGEHRWWELWKGKQPRDTRQLAWLDDRLRIAQAAGRAVIILFHIPALRNNETAPDVQLKGLHAIIGSYSCVKLVFCGHEHNLQGYAPQEFHRFVSGYGAAPAVPPEMFPPLFIDGGGGSFIHQTDWDETDYPCTDRYPNPEQYRGLVESGRRIVLSSRLSRTPFGTLVGAISRNTLSDGDEARYCSFLVVDVAPSPNYYPGQAARPHMYAYVRTVFLDDLMQLYMRMPGDRVVEVQTDSLPLDIAESCLRTTTIREPWSIDHGV